MIEGTVRLSPATLNLFIECPRCFWLKMNAKVERPRGKYPSLPGGMDGHIKNFFDGHRAQGTMPAELLEMFPTAKLFEDQAQLKKWRFWKTGAKYVDESIDAYLQGAIDEMLIDQDGTLIIPDYKTKGSAAKEVYQSYIDQMGSYALAFKQLGYNVHHQAVLIYYYPVEVGEGGVVQFKVQPQVFDIEPEETKKKFESAVECVRGSMPEVSSDCEMCNYIEKFTSMVDAFKMLP